MSVIDHLLGLLAPYECLGCSAEGSPLCASCRRRLPALPGRCYRCQRPSSGALTCSGCSDGPCNPYRVLARTPYAGVAKELVSGLKFSGTRTAAKVMAACMLPLLPADTSGALIVPVPTAASRVRGRGYDQAKLLARELSRQTGLPYLDCLARDGQTRQVGTSRRQRQLQLQGAFRVKRSGETKGADIMLVDDVSTTGATLEAAAAALDTEGAGRVSAAVFAQA
jgi:ComF family protein